MNRIVQSRCDKTQVSPDILLSALAFSSANSAAQTAFALASISARRSGLPKIHKKTAWSNLSHSGSLDRDARVV
jgi:hypothetical protein